MVDVLLCSAIIIPCLGETHCFHPQDTVEDAREKWHEYNEGGTRTKAMDKPIITSSHVLCIVSLPSVKLGLVFKSGVSFRVDSVYTSIISPSANLTLHWKYMVLKKRKKQEVQSTKLNEFMPV
jgi:hypothetical protein